MTHTEAILDMIRQWYRERRAEIKQRSAAAAEAERDLYDCGNALYEHITGKQSPPAGRVTIHDIEAPPTGPQPEVRFNPGDHRP